MDKNTLQIGTLSDLHFGRAQESDFLLLPSWFTTAEALTEWAGPSVSFPLNPQDLIHQHVDNAQYDSFVLTATISGKQELAAFGQVLIVRHRAHLARLCVNPQLRGLKLSKRLIHDLVREASRTNQINLVSLFVYDTNRIARACYRKMGFVELPSPPSIKTPDGCVYMVMHKSAKATN